MFTVFLRTPPPRTRNRSTPPRIATPHSPRQHAKEVRFRTTRTLWYAARRPISAPRRPGAENSRTLPVLGPRRVPLYTVTCFSRPLSGLRAPPQLRILSAHICIYPGSDSGIAAAPGQHSSGSAELRVHSLSRQQSSAFTLSKALSPASQSSSLKLAETMTRTRAAPLATIGKTMGEAKTPSSKSRAENCVGRGRGNYSTSAPRSVDMSGRHFQRALGVCAPSWPAPRRRA